jgi:hypothetical protein
MLELFQKVERRLNEIDKLLYDAGSGNAKVSSQAESGIAELLNTSKANGKEVLSGIDRILEIARQMGGQCSGAMSGQSNSKSPSDKPEQGSGKPQEREKTPEAPKPKGEKPEPNQPQQGENGQPKNPHESNSEPRNRKAEPPPPLETERVTAGQSNERWGDLPEQVRDLFRTEGGGDMPPQYRDWIDAYYRRLNQRR